MEQNTNVFKNYFLLSYPCFSKHIWAQTLSDPNSVNKMDEDISCKTTEKAISNYCRIDDKKEFLYQNLNMTNLEGIQWSVLYNISSFHLMEGKRYKKQYSY